MKKASKKRIVAIVVTYNRKKILKECIEALLKSETPCDILIVDNNSTDNTYNYISKYISDRVIYKNTGENLGGAGGFNFGMKEAIRLGYSYLWLMDDDVIVNENALSKLMDADKALNGNYGFLSSKVFFTDGKLCRMNMQKYVKNWTPSEVHIKNGLYKTNFATFVSFFTKKTVVEKVGLPIKEFFIWGDDIEYTNRISKKFDNYVVMNSKVTHKTKANLGSDISRDDERLDRYKYAYRNEMYIAKKNGIKGIIRYIAKINYHILKILIYSKGNKLKKIGIIFSNMFKGIKFNPKVEYIGGKHA